MYAFWINLTHIDYGLVITHVKTNTNEEIFKTLEKYKKRKTKIPFKVLKLKVVRICIKSW